LIIWVCVTSSIPSWPPRITNGESLSLIPTLKRRGGLGWVLRTALSLKIRKSADSQHWQRGWNVFWWTPVHEHEPSRF